eukprot:403354850
MMGLRTQNMKQSQEGNRNLNINKMNTQSSQGFTISYQSSSNKFATNSYPLAPMFSHQKTYKPMKIRKFQTKPMQLYDHASYLNQMNQKYLVKGQMSNTQNGNFIQNQKQMQLNQNQMKEKLQLKNQLFNLDNLGEYEQTDQIIINTLNPQALSQQQFLNPKTSLSQRQSKSQTNFRQNRNLQQKQRHSDSNQEERLQNIMNPKIPGSQIQDYNQQSQLQQNNQQNQQIKLQKSNTALSNYASSFHNLQALKKLQYPKIVATSTPQLQNKTPFKNEKILKSSLVLKGEGNLSEEAIHTFDDRSPPSLGIEIANEGNLFRQQSSMNQQHQFYQTTQQNSQLSTYNGDNNLLMQSQQSIPTKQLLSMKFNTQRQIDSDKMKKILQNKYREKMKLLEMKYNLNQDLIDRNQIKDQQNRRLFSPQNTQGQTLIGDGRLSHLSQGLEPFSEKVNYLETCEYVKTQHNFFNAVRKIEKQKEQHYKNFLSMNRLPQRNLYIKEAYSAIKLNNIYDEYMPSYKRIGLFTPQASQTTSQFYNSPNKQKLDFHQKHPSSYSNQKIAVDDQQDHSQFQNPHNLAQLENNLVHVLKDTSHLLEKEHKKSEILNKQDHKQLIENNLNRRRIVNITLDSDLDQIPTSGSNTNKNAVDIGEEGQLRIDILNDEENQDDYDYYGVKSNSQNQMNSDQKKKGRKVIDPVREQELREKESQKWMDRYNSKVFEGKVFKLKQNLNLVLNEMQQNQIKIMDFHSNIGKVIDDVEDDLITLENMQRLNQEQAKKKRR